MLFASLGLIASPVLSQTAQFRPAVNAQVAAARKVAPALGVHILELASGEAKYTYNADTRRILASNTKIITSAVALDRLGPAYSFETEILVRGELVDGTLNGTLAVLGGGDPSLSGRHYQGDPYGPFREWAAALEQAGIRRVEGDLLLVDGIFDDELVHPDWPKDQLSRWYEAPVSGLSFNDNCVLVKVNPGALPGQKARVETVPELPIFEVESSATITSRANQQWLKIDRRTTPGEEHVLTVAGRLYRRSEPRDAWVTVADPLAYFGVALRAALIEEGIFVTGRILASERLPRDERVWRRVTTHRSDLLTILEVVNKRSQNFYAESVLKLLGAEMCGRGSWSEGLKVARELLSEVGIPDGSYRLADGSGMSRNNTFTPEQLTRLLRHMYFHEWGKEYLATLPASGERDLSWRKRLASSRYRGRVRAKTGYLSGVSTLSGYATARSGKTYAFSILLNSIRGLNQAKTAQDRIVRALIDHG
ncbi:MAG: D-alanyl-D-alanine carboxypeptidase/D-alanyl-D-alanine-endopeptidase [Acidobacteriota bacterium]